MTPAARGIVVTFGALALASLFNADGLRKTAEAQPPGVGRDVALAVARPLARVSRSLYLDRPRHALQVAVGRGDADRIDARIAFPVPTPVQVATPRVVRPKRSRHHARKRVFAPSHPLRVWVAGDSLAQVPGDALARAAGSGGPVEVLAVESRLNTGLGSPILYNWFTRFRTAIRELRPNVAVLSFGADDAHDYMTGLPAGYKLGPLGSASWVAEYRRRLAGVTRELNAAGIYVVWLGLPVPRGPGFKHDFPVINAIVHGVAAKDRGRATFLDTWHLLDDRHGHYADYIRTPGGKLVLVRAPDGMHYTPAGGDLIARALLERLGAVYDLRRRRAA